MTPINKDTLRERIIRFLAQHSNESFKPMVLARRMSIKTDEEIDDFRDLLDEMREEGTVVRVKGGSVGHGSAPLSNRLTGVFRGIRQGQGLVETTGTVPPEKILITQKFRGTALDGDTVSVSVFARPVAAEGEPDALPEGEVVEIISRRTRSVIGTFEKGKNFFFVIPDSSRIGRDIYIPSGKTKGARPGEKVAARIVSWETPNLNPEGEVVTVLGKAGEVHVEMKGIREEFQLPDDFPAAVNREADAIPDEIPREEIRKRLDLRDLVIFTIDPADAKDHDDALSIRELGGGRVEVGVHIADVSHYVTEGSELDAEAMARGTSVYLPGTVIPMLPEKLSADLCSLMPNTDRLAYSVLIEFSPDGVPGKYSIRKTVIHCCDGFSYEEAQEVIDKKSGRCSKELLLLHRFSKMLLEARIRNGSIDFDTPEVAFRFDDKGLPSQIVKKERLESHRLIEEFMLQANQTVAGHIERSRKGTGARPFVYRIHDYPEPGKLRDFSSFVEHLGYSFHIKNGVTSRAFQTLLAAVRGKEEENVINELAIRTMAKAVYSDSNIGHFGLGFRFYTHFTSPIRRYPDLIVHRLLHEYEERGAGARTEMWRDLLPGICSHSSAREKLATEAERASIKVMQVEYMKRHVGDAFDAIVSGVTNFGLFVEINDLLVEGLIRMRDLEDDFYVFDEKKYQLVGRRSKRSYRLGDRVRVKVVRVDPEDRQMDFIIVDAPGEGGDRGRTGERRGGTRGGGGGKGSSGKGGGGKGSGGEKGRRDRRGNEGGKKREAGKDAGGRTGGGGETPQGRGRGGSGNRQGGKRRGDGGGTGGSSGRGGGRRKRRR